MGRLPLQKACYGTVSMLLIGMVMAHEGRKRNISRCKTPLERRKPVSQGGVMSLAADRDEENGQK